MIFALGVLPVLFLLCGFPIFIVLIASASVAVVFFMQMPLPVLHQTLYGALDSYPLLAVPFFIYAGELMGRGSITTRIVDFVQEGVGPVRGSVGLTTVGTSAIFGAISGVSAASVATIGRAMLPALRKDNYPETFSAGLVTAMGAIDVVIPPSVPMIIYASAAQQSLPKLYAAGVLPGILISLMIASYVVWFAARQGIGAGRKFHWNAFVRATGRSAWALGAPVIILGGIYGGVFSPTEAAAVACLYSMFVTRLVFRELSLRDILDIARTTALFTSQILIIVACASVFGWLLTVNQVPAQLIAWINALAVPHWTLLFTVNVLLLAVGCFIDPISAILLLSPLLVPMMQAIGVDAIHFGVIMTVNLAIGLFHPPFGINIFVAQSVLGLDLKTIYRGIVPFLLIYLLALALITYIPWISLGSMRMLMGH